MNQLFSWLGEQKLYSITLCRVIIGVILIYAGFEKLFLRGIPAVISGWTDAHLFAAPVLGTLAPLLEFFGGMAIVLGIFSRLLSIWVIIQFFIITIYINPVLFNSGWHANRIALVLFTFGILFLTNGPGALSLGRLIFKDKSWGQ